MAHRPLPYALRRLPPSPPPPDRATLDWSSHYSTRSQPLHGSALILRLSELLCHRISHHRHRLKLCRRRFELLRHRANLRRWPHILPSGTSLHRLRILCAMPRSVGGRIFPSTRAGEAAPSSSPLQGRWGRCGWAGWRPSRSTSLLPHAARNTSRLSHDRGPKTTWGRIAAARRRGRHNSSTAWCCGAQRRDAAEGECDDCCDEREMQNRVHARQIWIWLCEMLLLVGVGLRTYC